MAYYWNKDGNVMDREIRRNESISFFKNLRHLAKSNGLTNRELANVLGTNPTYLSKYLKGTVVPREDAFETMKKYATDFFDVSITELIDGNFEEIVVAEPIKEEDGTESTVLNEMINAINKRKERVAQLQKEIDALEHALTLMKAEDIL